MLPGLSGIEVLRRLRKENIQTPVILLTACSVQFDAVCGKTRLYGVKWGVRQEATSSAQSQCLFETILLHRIFPSETAL